ncbi:MAG TPA: 1-(5-phosphoribosyl)-5-[(5-phosphoribosylamino)methylideneamino]imidazole-4-carboxamide isomerase [Candidatus Methanoperedenaceae archaeon]|nr:1-(5-phosphoribosyl)-5-[(5-phosphoribosylamino)methylideneamino]imidazole-4-carboxamide isomerase [Candidatus Methanoperedenaceae archaeon]
MGFDVIPAIDLRGGKCVQLVQGVPGTEAVILDPFEAAQKWVSAGARILHIIDLDGAIGGTRSNARIVARIISEFNVEVQVGGGVRSKKDVETLLDTGAERVIVGTMAVNNPPVVKELADAFGREHIMAALDSRKGEVATHGWAKSSRIAPVELGKKLEELGAGSVLFTHIDKEGLLGGVDPKPTREMAEALRIPVIASGGVASIEDIITIKKTGAKGVVVGMALYRGRFTLEEALHAAGT